MDVEDIRDEVDEFNEDYFVEYLDLIDDNFDFIEENGLVVPKKNYLFTYNFLNFTMGHFSNLDYKFVSPTLRKLHNDILMLYKNLEKQKEFKNDIDSIFEIFLKTSQMFVDIKNALIGLQKIKTLSEDDVEEKKVLNRHYSKLKEIYAYHFHDSFMEQNRYIISSFQNILNCKLAYFEKILWVDASKSDAITRTLRGLGLVDNLNSALYLKQRLSVALPYTDDYHYLMKCLKVYK